MKKSILLLFLVFFVSQRCFSQSPNYKETIDFINEKLNGKCVVEVVKGEVVSKYYNAENKMVRKDNTMAEFFNIDRVYYEKEQKMLCIECLKSESPCVTRNLYVDRQRSKYSRTSFSVEDEKAAQSLIKAFTHLLKMVQDDRHYKETVTFE